MFKKAKKIQTKITIPIVVLALVIALSIGIFSTMVTKTSTMNALEKTLVETAELAASTFENTIATYRACLTEIAANDILTSGTATFEEKYDFLQERAKAQGFLTATLIDKNGDDPITGLNSNGQEYFERSMQGEFYLSSPYPYSDGSSMYVVVSAPVMKNGAVDSVICFTLDQSFLQQVVENIVVGESDNGDVYILDKHGTTVASLEYELALAQENLVSELYDGTIGEGDRSLAAVEEKMIGGGSGVEEYSDGDGIDYMQSYAHISGSDGWSVAVCIDTAEFMRSATIGNYVLIGVAIFLVIICAICARFIGASIARPIVRCADRLKLLAQGDLKTPVPVFEGRDEVKTLALSTSELIDSFSQIIDEVDTTLSNIADGDLSHDLDTVQYPGDFAPLKENLITINDRLNKTVSNIGIASDQVYNGAQQVSSGAQELAQGATQQASSVQELSATITEVSDRVKNTAGNADTANQRAAQAGEKLAECSQQMQELVAAMSDISAKSDEISKIIKVIEDIAFQTNILALNAAVEAARAGAAGKGFAVVADEVRNLAGKSAEASQSTSSLIESSTVSVQSGMRVLELTAAALKEAVASSQQSAAMIQAISHDANEQAVAISQITEAIDQISSVVQTTSATSEESAATSEELSSQAQLLKGLVEQFTLRDISPADFGCRSDDYPAVSILNSSQKKWDTDKY